MAVPWVDLWIERDPSLDRGRRAESRERRRNGELAPILAAAGWTIPDVRNLYALADRFEPKQWRREASATLSRAHRNAQKARDLLREAGSPSQLVQSAEDWRGKLAWLGVTFFPEDKSRRAPRDLRAEARRLLLRCGLQPAGVARVETEIMGGQAEPKRRGELSPRDALRNKIKRLAHSAAPPIWRHLRLVGSALSWRGDDCGHPACSHCRRR